MCIRDRANEQSEVDGINVINEKNVINGKSIPVHCVFDNEEVGSGTKQGAASTFLADTPVSYTHLYIKTRINDLVEMRDFRWERHLKRNQNDISCLLYTSRKIAANPNNRKYIPNPA